MYYNHLTLSYSREPMVLELLFLSSFVEIMCIYHPHLCHLLEKEYVKLR